MVGQIYGGCIVRAYIGHDDFILTSRSKERVFVRAINKEYAELLIHEAYNKNQIRWTPHRTSHKFPGDRIFIEDLKNEEELREKYGKSLEEKTIEEQDFLYQYDSLDFLDQYDFLD